MVFVYSTVLVTRCIELLAIIYCVKCCTVAVMVVCWSLVQKVILLPCPL